MIVNFPMVANSATLFGNSTSYTTARQTANSVTAATNYFHVGQALAGGGSYYVYRAAIKFDTRELPSAAIILDAWLRMTVQQKTVDTDFSTLLVDHDWSYSDPINGSRDTVYTGIRDATNILAWYSSSEVSVNTPAEKSLSSSISYITKGDYSYFGLRSGREGTTPTNNEYMQFYGYSYATSTYRPYLVVEYEIPQVGQAFFLT